MSSSVARTAVLSLYRRLLRLQQGLPSDLSALGTLFIREEFKKHRNVPSDQAEAFMTEWTEFASNLESQVSTPEPDQVKGQHISSEELKFLSDAQLLQLGELHKEATKPPAAT